MTATDLSSRRQVGPGAALWLLLGALASGCTSFRPSPPDLDLGRAWIVQDPAATNVVIDGPSGKGSAAALGAAKGGGTGATVGTLACLGTGFLFPLCVITVVPASMAIGAAGWATAAAVHAEGSEAVGLKREMLAAELASGAYPSKLAAYLRDAAHARLALDLDLASAATDAGPRAGAAHAWTIELALTEVASTGHAEGRPYALRVEGRLRLRRATQTDAAFEATLATESASTLTTAEWAANDNAELHAALDQLVRSLAEKLLASLASPVARS